MMRSIPHTTLISTFYFNSIAGVISIFRLAFFIATRALLGASFKLIAPMCILLVVQLLQAIP